MAAYLDWINVMTYDFHGKFYFSHILYNEYVHMCLSYL
jgi:GH18 family chitinase